MTDQTLLLEVVFLALHSLLMPSSKDSDRVIGILCMIKGHGLVLIMMSYFVLQSSLKGFVRHRKACLNSAALQHVARLTSHHTASTAGTAALKAGHMATTTATACNPAGTRSVNRQMKMYAQDLSIIYTGMQTDTEGNHMALLD